MAQSAKHWTLGFGSGHDLAVRGIEPRVKLCAGSVEPAWGSLCPSPAHERMRALSLSLSLSLSNK